MLEICVEYKNDEETFNFYIKQVGERKIVLYFGWLDFQLPVDAFVLVTPSES